MNIIAFARIAILFLFLGVCQGATWTVNQSDSIQAMINEASPGDIILVNEGIFYENVFINKSMVLQGLGMPIIDGNGTGSAIALLADGIILKGFEVKINSSSSKAENGITVNSIDNVIRYNKIENSKFGIFLNNSSHNIIEANILNDNVVGINLLLGSENQIMGNNLSKNAQGLLVSGSRNNTIVNNSVSHNSRNGASIENSINNTIKHNDISYVFSWLALPLAFGDSLVHSVPKLPVSS
jgi:nitrous oxidase accessory protein